MQVEKRGQLVNQNTGQYELLVLRRDSLRIFEVNPQGKHTGLPMHLLLAQPCEVLAKPNGLIEIQPRMPNDAKHVFVASTEAEARAWQESIQKSIAKSRERSKEYLKVLAQGNSAHKYNYSNSKRMRRHFWIDEERVELCWGKNRAESEPQTMDLKDCMGIIYGPMTSTFLRCQSIEDPASTCFSLLFQDRTLDMAVPAESIETWFLGLQFLLLERGSSCQAGLTHAQFLYRKVCLKLRDSAHTQGLTTCTLLLRQVRTLRHQQRSTPAVSVGAEASDADEKAERRRRRAERKAAEAKAAEAKVFEPQSRRATAPAGIEVKEKESKESKKAKAGQTKPTTNGDTPYVVSPEEEALCRMAQELDSRLELMTADLQVLQGKWTGELKGKLPGERLQEVLKWDGVSWQAEKCSEIEKEVLGLRLASAATQAQLSAAEKHEKQLKKLAKQIKDSDAQAKALEQELSAVQAGAHSSEQAKHSTAASLQRTEAQTSHLERRVQELEQQLQQAQQGGDLEVLQQQNQKQAEELARLEAAKADLTKKLEAVQKDCKASEAKQREHKQKLAALEGTSQRLVGCLGQLRKEVSTLKAQQQQAKSDAEAVLRSIADEFPPLSSAVQRIKAGHDNLMERYQEIVQERKKLHNLVLELKGNIRVFVRVRPMNDKEKQAEPPGEPTITFAEDCKVSVFEAAQSRRKWFEFDKAFAPKASQQEVFEEVKPLATSVLDGYNVCIFAYGQTGSGKTFTMNGTAENPGLNVRVLKELFREREERSVGTDISISLMITEIYNETIKDLFVEKQKKLDVKQNADGSNSVPGLTEVAVSSVDDVMAAMKSAQSNRTVMATDMNEESSRSHSIVQVRTLSVSKKDKREYIGKINLIDLAGSENVNKSGVSGQGMREAQNINKSLSALGDVIGSLVAKNPHIPYRNSKLTMMLKDSLGGDSKTLMIVQSSPAQINVTETLSSLNFASRARNVELGKAKRNVKGGE